MKHDIQELTRLQGLPLKAKVSLTQQRIQQWVLYYGLDNVYVSFSGGKDSTVLLDIARKMYPNIQAVFINTGLEYPEIVDFVNTFDNVAIITPNHTFKDVICKYGYPMVSKEVSECVAGARKYLDVIIKENSSENAPYYYLEKLLGSGVFSKNDKPSKELEDLADMLNSRMLHKEGGSNQRLAQLLGIFTNDSSHPINANVTQNNRSVFSQEKWKFLLKAPFDVSNQCCTAMKKSPAHGIKKYKITAQMASESRLRTQKWLDNGCNGFDLKKPTSNPMAFWTNQDVLTYIRLNDIQIASVYGDVVTEEELIGQMTIGDFLDLDLMELFEFDRPTFCTTGCNRTGCVFCGFGLHLEKRPNRLEMIDKVSNPRIRDFCLRGGAFTDEGLWKPDNRGLGMWFVIQYINVHGGFDIFIPEYDKYEKMYGNDLTNKYLYGGDNDAQKN